MSEKRQERFEYRVRWRRQDLGPRTAVYQTEAGARRKALVLQGRMAEATGLDPDAKWCCNGNYCPCDGRTNQQEWDRVQAELPPLTFGPVIERRPVGEWQSAEVSL